VKHATIKELVFDFIHRHDGRVDYAKLMGAVLREFPTSAFKRTHWYWYRYQCTKGRFADQFSAAEKAGMAATKRRHRTEVDAPRLAKRDPREDSAYLTATQVGAVAEQIVAGRIIQASAGRLNPYLPVADDGGVDLLVFDKETRHAVPVQVKSRTGTLRRYPKVVHFQIRKKTFSEMPGSVVVAMLFDWETQEPRCMWLLPAAAVAANTRTQGANYVLRPSIAPDSRDRWRPYRCEDFDTLVERLIELLETGSLEPRRPRGHGPDGRTAWEQVRRSVRAGDQLWTPGRGIPPAGHVPFHIGQVTTGWLTIEVGKSGLTAKLPAVAFDAVLEHLRTHRRTLRVAAAHSNEPLAGSVDKVVREALDKNFASGNYVAAILEHAGLVEYVMKGRQKHIRPT